MTISNGFGKLFNVRSTSFRPPPSSSRSLTPFSVSLPARPIVYSLGPARPEIVLVKTHAQNLSLFLAGLLALFFLTLTPASAECYPPAPPNQGTPACQFVNGYKDSNGNAQTVGPLTPFPTQIAAGTNQIGFVGGFEFNVGTIPTVQNAAYTAGQSLGGLQSVSIGSTSGLSGILTQFQLSSKAGSTVAVVAYVWDKNPTNTTCTDKTNFVVSQTDNQHLVGSPILLTPALVVSSQDTSTYALSSNLTDNFVNSSATTNLYVCLLANASVTPATTTDYRFKSPGSEGSELMWLRRILYGLLAVAFLAASPAYAFRTIKRLIVLNGIQAWSYAGSSYDLNFLLNGGTCTKLRILITCGSALSWTNSTGGYVTWADGHVSLVAASTPRISDQGALIEVTSTNNALYARDMT